ncbi:hypothetical protein WA026_007367 [Henosepilachna vigintioctopunctata]|uniref:Uncharacterized protein n=1 Tax=Henosepilachna vigintioctopunctata TaxID=420089 RepID=A0AAW1UX35_9CUCU
MLLRLDSNINMGKVKKSTDVVDEVKGLFDLLKEGTSYILHIYLSFLSKIIPVDFIEKLFDDHKDKSSYDFSKSGKTYIYRLLNAIIELEKKLVAIVFNIRWESTISN